MSFKLSFYPDHESLKTDNLPEGELIMMQVSPESSLFNFPGTLKYTDNADNKIEKDSNICLENNKKLHFQTLKSLVNILMNKLCKEPFDCLTKDDLKEFDDNNTAIELNMTGKVVHSASLKDGNLK